MPLYLRHGPEKDVHRFPGCLIVFVTDKAVLLGCFLEDRRMVHPQGYLRPDPGKHLVRTLGKAWSDRWNLNRGSASQTCFLR